MISTTMRSKRTVTKLKHKTLFFCTYFLNGNFLGGIQRYMKVLQTSVWVSST